MVGIVSPAPAPPVTHPFSAIAPLKQEILSENIQRPRTVMEISEALPLLMRFSPRSAHTGLMKTGGRVFVLDHTTLSHERDNRRLDAKAPQEEGDPEARGSRLCKHGPSFCYRSRQLHPTFKLYKSCYVKHLGKPLNISSSLNTSPEKTSVDSATVALFNRRE